MISAARICALIDARQYDAAIDAAGDAPAIDPHDPYALGLRGTALRLRDPGLYPIKTDPLLDPVRKQPRYQAAMRELKLPQ